MHSESAQRTVAAGRPECIESKSIAPAVGFECLQDKVLHPVWRRVPGGVMEEGSREA